MLEAEKTCVVNISETKGDRVVVIIQTDARLTASFSMQPGQAGTSLDFNEARDDRVAVS